MERFGRELRALRIAAGWQQADLAAALGDQIARSTLANIEGGRQPPTPRIWSLVCEYLPGWATQLGDEYERARRLPKPLPIDSSAVADRALLSLLEVRLVYVFRHSRSPVEILELRKVRAKVAGVDGYDLRFIQTTHEGFRSEEECLWGGALANGSFEDGGGTTQYVRRVVFGKELRRGQSHEFALRSYVMDDPKPDLSVCAAFAVPCRLLTFHLNFSHLQPRKIWRFGPVPDNTVFDDGFSIGKPLKLGQGGTVTVVRRNPPPGTEQGVGWRW